MLTKHHSYSTIKYAITDFIKGKPVILIDALNRENEADLIIPAQKITIKIMAQMIHDGSGIVCLCINKQKAKQLNLQPMVLNNQSRFHTAFTTSIEASNGVSTGVSAADRVKTIQTAINDHVQDNDIVSPGHVFPLIAKENGLFDRMGHTEGSVDLSIMAGFKPYAVLCELMNPDGTMMRDQELLYYAKQHDLCIINIGDLLQYKKSFFN